MAVRIPVVTTAKGCEGIAHEGAFWVADSPQGFKRAILDVLSGGEEVSRRAAQARAVFDRTYSLEANMQVLENVIANAVLNRARFGRGGVAPFVLTNCQIQPFLNRTRV